MRMYALFNYTCFGNQLLATAQDMQPLYPIAIEFSESCQCDCCLELYTFDSSKQFGSVIFDAERVPEHIEDMFFDGVFQFGFKRKEQTNMISVNLKLSRDDIHNIIHGLNMVSSEIGNRASDMMCSAMFAENDDVADAFSRRADVYEDNMFRVEDVISMFEDILKGENDD